MLFPDETDTLARLRTLVLGLVAAGYVGTAVELTLLAHYEDALQYAPFLVIGAALAALAWRAVKKSRASTLAVQIVMIVSVAAGAIGVVLHYRANMEFQLDIDRSLSGVALVRKVLEAKAPPALAPANMSLLGLLGLAGTYRETFGG